MEQWFALSDLEPDGLSLAARLVGLGVSVGESRQDHQGVAHLSDMIMSGPFALEPPMIAF
jgi:hypothetical protein